MYSWIGEWIEGTKVLIDSQRHWNNQTKRRKLSEGQDNWIAISLNKGNEEVPIMIDPMSRSFEAKREEVRILKAKQFLDLMNVEIKVVA